ncbi:MAG: hypothetical protein WAK01_12420 [Methylocystis sp.]
MLDHQTTVDATEFLQALALVLGAFATLVTAVRGLICVLAAFRRGSQSHRN